MKLPMPGWLRQLANIGVHGGLDHLDVLRIKMINRLCLIAMPFNLFFLFSNYAAGRFSMAFCNLVLAIGCVSVLYLHLRRRYEFSNWVIVATSFIFTTQAIFFRNGSEMLLVMNMVTGQLFYHRKKWINLYHISNICLFMLVKIYELQPVPYITVSPGKYLFNTLFGLVFVFISIQFFRMQQAAQQSVIERQNKALADEVKTRELLLSIVSHDVRTPVGQVKGILQLVQDPEVPREELTSMARLLARRTDELQANLDNLLAWAQHQAKGIQTVAEPLNIEEAVRQATNVYAGVLAEKGLRLTVQLAPATVLADRQQMQVVLRNVLSNAVKFSNPRGQISISGQLADGRYRMNIQDHGLGMSGDRLTQFQQGHLLSSTRGTADEKGTGLGLQLCRRFMEENGGRFSVNSCEGKGTTVTVWWLLA